jgi:hypothetical protein
MARSEQQQQRFEWSDDVGDELTLIYNTKLTEACLHQVNRVPGQTTCRIRGGGGGGGRNQNLPHTSYQTNITLSKRLGQTLNIR